MKRLIIFILSVTFTATALADGFVPPVVVQPPEQIVVPQQPRVLQKKIKWMMVPNVVEMNVPTVVRYGVFGQMIVRNNKVLVTVWEWKAVQVWE